VSEILVSILVAPLAILLYGSGLLLWPLWKWRHREQKTPGKAVGRVSLAQLVAFFVVACCSIFIRLDHFYYWFIFLIQLNILFTIAGIIAWKREKRSGRF
jgi:hypothetical protein